MRIYSAILFCLFALLSCFPAAAPAFAQERPFANREVQFDADRYETYVKANWKASPKKPAELRLVADRLMATDPRAASREYAGAVATDPRNAESWLGLARALLAIPADPNQGSERFDIPVNASGAAYKAYQRAIDKTVKARALAVLSDALQRRSFWRPAIEAIKASTALVPDPRTTATYEKLRAEHGFRMTDYKTEAEQASPRVCVQFSENLARGKVDFGKFVAVDGKDPQGLIAESQQLCFEGLTHGQRYEVTIRAGLPSDVEETLTKPVALAIYVPDRKPFVRFTGKSYVLPSRGQQGIPIVTVNTEKVSVQVYRIGDRNLASELESSNLDRQLSTYDISEIKDRKGSLIYEGELDVVSKLNQEVTTALPIDEAVGELKPGAYAVVARPTSDTNSYSDGLATQWFIVSDLGLTAFSGTDGVHGFVRSLATTEAIAGAKVKLVARNNEVLAETKSDDKGYVRFDGGLAKGEGGSAPAILVAENGAGEYAFLDLTANAFDLSDRGVKGRDAPGPLDAYLYTERGVYRPGEEANVTAIVRDAAGHAEALPTTLIVTRPDGVEHDRYTLADQGLGGRSQGFTVPGSAMTGTWRAKLHADPKDAPLAQVAFLVEDYVPERLDMTLAPATGVLSPSTDEIIKVVGRYLYGPPAANLTIEGEVVVKPSKSDLAAFPGYRFGLDDEKVDPVRKPLEGLAGTNADGKSDVKVSLPAIPRTARPLEANVILKLREESGRVIERAVTLPVELGEPRIGLKPLFPVNGVDEGQKAEFEVVRLDEDGKPSSATGLVWELVRLDTTWQWYSRDGYWTYEAQTLTRKAANGSLDVTADTPARIAADVAYGRYRLEVRTADRDGPVTSIAFNAGWYGGNETAESPEFLDVGLDKASYQPGETAKLRIASKSGGKALVSVLGSGLHLMKEVELPKGGGDVELAVGSDWGAGAYATALLYRPMDEKAKRMPSRAIGITWIGIDQTQRTLQVDLSYGAVTPKGALVFEDSSLFHDKAKSNNEAAKIRIESGSKLLAYAKVKGLEPGEEARITIAAVDLGILNLTRFQAPAPEAYFFAQTKLGIEVRDFYGRLIDGMRAERGKLRSGGDGSDDLGLKGSPPVEETVAFYSGIVTVGADGTAKAEFQMPDFNGTVHVMAVAWSKTKLGHATGDVIVRDAVALTASAPRFITLGDEVRFDLAVHNVEGPAGAYNVAVTQNPVDGLKGEAVSLASRSLDLKTGDRKAERLAVKPMEVGLHTYDVSVTGGDGIDVKRRLSLDVKPPAGDIKRTTALKIAGKGGRFTLSKDLVAGLIADRTRVNISVGPFATLDVPGLLTSLDRYPYGCAEQTVSRAMPLLYANAVAAEIGIAPDKELKERVASAIGRVFELQDGSGAFGIWGPDGGDMWLTSYVTDFLTRAKETGYDVRAIPFNQALDRLQNFITNAGDFESGGEDRAYALYVLARNGRAPIGELRYYADTRLDRLSTPLAKAQLGSALSMMGDKERAETAFRAALTQFDEAGQLDLARLDYGSRLRDGAALVTLASETGVSKGEAPRLVNVIGKAYAARTYTSTQEQAWMLLAAKAMIDQSRAVELAINGAPVKGPLIRGLSARDLEANPLVIGNNGEEPVDAVVSVTGASLTGEPPVAKGFRIERTYYTLDGKQVDLASASGGASAIKQNDRLVAVVRIDSDEAAGRVLLVDRLPSGLEIENPRLVDSGDEKTLDWLTTKLKPEHTEFRDDRFVAAFNLFPSQSNENGSDTAGDAATEAEGQGTPEDQKKSGASAASATVAYIVRAVTPGSFVHPAATVEDMYRPERHARTAAGKLTIGAGE
ncbi:MAG: alpha-2-macroglobulin family protein [Hyphomicrobium sp.]